MCCHVSAFLLPIAYYNKRFFGIQGLLISEARPRAISTGQLHPLLGFHFQPIYRVVFPGPYQIISVGVLILGWTSRLDAFSAYSSQGGYPALHLAVQLVHQCLVPSGPLVLGRAPLRTPAPAADKDRAVSRRSEPNSRASLMGEQPNPWDLLQPQDETGRHRGAKRIRRYGLSGPISLLSPG